MMDTRTLARALGGVAVGRNAVNAPGPGHSPGDRSLSVRLDPAAPEGFLTYSHAGDDWRVCRDHVRRKLGLPDWQPGDEQDRRVQPSRRKEFDQMAINREAERRERTEDDLMRIAKATRLWEGARDPGTTIAVKYLQSRALELPSDVFALRFHSRCPWRDENTGTTIRIPALIAAFTSIDDDMLTAVHRIRLDQPERWPKVERRMLGVMYRAAVKLDPLWGDTLVIGEGVETCLAARQLGYGPVWALGSVGAISFFPVIPSVRRLMILGETGKASQEKIQICGRRWQRVGRRVQIVMPDVGSDLNDQLMMQRV
jgi:putative DNA primase/helicase